LSTSLPAVIAWSIARARLKLVQSPRPSASRCVQAWSARMRAAGATPTMPRRLPATEAMTPATAVPWRSAAPAPPGMKFRVSIAWPRRSGWWMSMPVSTMAIRTPLPVAHRCARVIPESESEFCSDRYGSSQVPWPLDACSSNACMRCTDSTRWSASRLAITPSTDAPASTSNTAQWTPRLRMGQPSTDVR
jgi:hypothetical protein